MRHQDRYDWDGARMAGAVVLVTVVGAGAWVLEAARRKHRTDKRRPDMPALAGGKGSQVERTVTILRSPAELYAIWRDLERLPDLMSHLESVTLLGGGRSRWVARGPAELRLTCRGDLQGMREGIRASVRRKWIGHELASNKSSRCHPYGIAHR